MPALGCRELPQKASVILKKKHKFSVKRPHFNKAGQTTTVLAATVIQIPIFQLVI